MINAIPRCISKYVKRINRKSIGNYPFVNICNTDSHSYTNGVIIDLDDTLWNFNSGTDNMCENLLFPQNKAILEDLKKIII